MTLLATQITFTSRTQFIGINYPRIHTLDVSVSFCRNRQNKKSITNCSLLFQRN